MAARTLARIARLVIVTAALFLLVSLVLVALRPGLRHGLDPRWLAYLLRPLPLLALGWVLARLARTPARVPRILSGEPLPRGGPVARIIATALLVWACAGALAGVLDLRLDRTGYTVGGPAASPGISEWVDIVRRFFLAYAPLTALAAVAATGLVLAAARWLHRERVVQAASDPWLHAGLAAMVLLRWAHKPRTLPDRLSTWDPASLGLAQTLGVAVVFALGLGVLPALLARRRLVPAALVAAGMAVLVFGGLALAGREKLARAASGRSSRIRVLLVTVDTLRADHLGAYGSTAGASPQFDRLAREGVLFDRAYCAMPTTDPSHVSLLTGAYPRRHGVLKNGLRIVAPDAIPHLALWFAQRGCVTGAITSRLKLDPDDIGLRGFSYTSVPTHLFSGLAANRTLERGRGFLERYGGGDYFLWVHLWDPHWSYDPPQGWAARFERRPGNARPSRKPHLFLEPGEHYSPAEAAWLIGRYDGEVAFADDAIGKLVEAAVRAAGNGPRPIVAVTADHGETLDELQDSVGYVFGHGEMLHAPQLRVPLLLWSPGLVPAGVRVGGVVETLGIAPTLADLAALLAASAGRPVAAGYPGSAFPCDGASLAPLFLPGAAAPRASDPPAAFIERRHFAGHPVAWLNVPERSVIEGRYRLNWNAANGLRLYDLIADPEEAHDLAAVRPDLVGALRDRLARWEREHPATVLPTLEIPEDKRELLESLGYVH